MTTTTTDSNEGFTMPTATAEVGLPIVTEKMARDPDVFGVVPAPFAVDDAGRIVLPRDPAQARGFVVNTLLPLRDQLVERAARVRALRSPFRKTRRGSGDADSRFASAADNTVSAIGRVQVQIETAQARLPQLVPPLIKQRRRVLADLLAGFAGAPVDALPAKTATELRKALRAAEHEAKAIDDGIQAMTWEQLEGLAQE